jgi:FdhD protein
VRVHEYVDGRLGAHEDRLATEEPLEIRLSWPGASPRRLAVTMRTPGHDFPLAAGFLLTEGLVGAAEQLQTVAYCTDETLAPEQEFNVVTVELRQEPLRPPAERYDGPGAATSACGVCGTQSIDDVLARTGSVRPDETTLTVPAGVLLELPDRLRDAQKVFDRTGGLHAAGLFEADGTPIVVREDIGRHNAVDKVLGERLLAAAPVPPVLCVSGRIGFEIVQKAVTGGVHVLVAVGAPSSLAVDLAIRSGLTTLGFVRGGRFVIYSAPERVGV